MVASGKSSENALFSVFESPFSQQGAVDAAEEVVRIAPPGWGDSLHLSPPVGYFWCESLHLTGANRST